MKVECRTLFLILLHQIAISNGQIIGTPPLLQLLFPAINGNQQQQQPLFPLNPLNFLQLLRPAPSTPLAPLSPTNSQQPQFNGIIPFMMQNFLQNIRPNQQTTGGLLNPGIQTNAAPTGTNGGILNPGILTNAAPGGNLQPNGGGLTGLNIGNILNLQQLLQQMNPLGNIPILLGLRPNALNQVQADGANGQVMISNMNVDPNLSITQQPINPNMMPENNFNSISTLQQPVPNADKPVTEFSNDFGQTNQSPFVSLVPQNPISPQNPTLISYIPYTTTVKPFTSNTDSNLNTFGLGPNAFDGNPSGETITKVTTEHPTTFIPLYFERRPNSPIVKPSAASNEMSKEVRPITSAITDADSIEHSSLFSKFITSDIPTSPLVAEEQVVTSPSMILITKKNESMIGVNRTSESQNVHDVPKIISENKPIKNDQKSDGLMKPISGLNLEKGVEPDEIENYNKLSDKGPFMGLIDIQNDEIPNDFYIPGIDQIPSNEYISNPGLYEFNDPSAYPDVGLYPVQNQNFINSKPVFNYPINSGSLHQNPIVIINKLQPHGNNNLYDNIPPHFAYQQPNSNWYHPYSPLYYYGWEPQQQYGSDPNIRGFPEPPYYDHYDY